jgi:hypothetical protein
LNTLLWLVAVVALLEIVAVLKAAVVGLVVIVLPLLEKVLVEEHPQNRL